MDPRYQMSFFAEEIDSQTLEVRDVLESSSGKSGGEKESFAGTIVAASLAYVLTPDGYDRPIYCTVFLDEAFSNTAEAVSRRVLRVFKEFVRRQLSWPVRVNYDGRLGFLIFPTSSLF